MPRLFSPFGDHGQEGDDCARVWSSWRLMDRNLITFCCCLRTNPIFPEKYLAICLISTSHMPTYSFPRLARLVIRMRYPRVSYKTEKQDVLLLFPSTLHIWDSQILTLVTEFSLATFPAFVLVLPHLYPHYI